MEQTVRYEVDEGVGTITFARPDAMNALDVATKEQLLAAVTSAAADPLVRCVLLTGTGRAFCVGQDLREHVRLLTGGDESLWRTVPEHYNPTVTALATMDKPVVAALNGVAAGAGASLAMAADLRLVAASAGFNLAFTGVALSADTGASFFLPRLVGLGRATDLLLRPRTVGAEEALAIGLATEVVPDEEPARARPRGRGRAGGRADGRLRRDPPGGGVLRRARAGRGARARGPAHGEHRWHGRPRRGRAGVPRQAPAAVHRGLSQLRAGSRSAG